MARILTVEDEMQVLTLAESVLQEHGHETLDAGTVAEAQAIINDTGKEFDLLFTDIELGNHKDGGISLGKLTEATRPGTPVLYTSGRELTDGLQSLLAKPSAFLPKPYTAKELADAVGSLLKGSDAR